MGKLPAQEDLARHLLSDELVAVEGVVALGARRLRRARLPDVVQQGCEPHDGLGRRVVHGERGVPEHIPGVEGVLLEPDAFEQLRRDAGEDARAAQEPESAAGRLSADQQLQELVADPLPRNLGEDVERLRNGLLGGTVERESQRGGEADRAERAQAVLAKARQRIAHRAEPPVLEIAHAAERIAQVVGERIPGDGIDGEVAAGEVALDLAEEGHRGGPAPVEVGAFAAEGGHFDVVGPGEHRDGAVGDAGRRGAREEALHFLGERVGRDIEVLRRSRFLAERGAHDVPHRAAGDESLLPGGAQAPQHEDDVLGNEVGGKPHAARLLRRTPPLTILDRGP